MAAFTLFLDDMNVEDEEDIKPFEHWTFPNTSATHSQQACGPVNPIIISDSEDELGSSSEAVLRPPAQPNGPPKTCNNRIGKRHF